MEKKFYTPAQIEILVLNSGDVMLQDSGEGDDSKYDVIEGGSIFG